MSEAMPLAPIAVVVSHTVADFDTWKAAFDADENRRRAASVVGHHINRSQEDPNDLSIFIAATDAGKVEEFANSDELKSAMQAAGVTSTPEMRWITPAREAVIWDRQLPAFLLSHTVADFDKWLQAYNDADELRTSKGIIGHAANRSNDDPSVAVVYHQAESFGTLRDFLKDPELRAVMDAAGVTSEPEVSFHTGGWGKQY